MLNECEPGWFQITTSGIVVQSPLKNEFRLKCFNMLLYFCMCICVVMSCARVWLSRRRDSRRASPPLCLSPLESLESSLRPTEDPTFSRPPGPAILLYLRKQTHHKCTQTHTHTHTPSHSCARIHLCMHSHSLTHTTHRVPAVLWVPRGLRGVRPSLGCQRSPLGPVREGASLEFFASVHPLP